ncbi:uncharacterized protein LOC116601909 isoform X2 [Nematostella vectensis]|uniref:uncharacterized protein LOC116601909 isoform X2 n=1 Tax=Nematostella vectensis TaxID=45351 RepID=UPI0020772BD8|nr:uncharacterized protein LOC116601909 isoform X2 [Nematostella vectensis]
MGSYEYLRPTERHRRNGRLIINISLAAIVVFTSELSSSSAYPLKSDNRVNLKDGTLFINSNEAKAQFYAGDKSSIQPSRMDQDYSIRRQQKDKKEITPNLPRTKRGLRINVARQINNKLNRTANGLPYRVDTRADEMEPVFVHLLGRRRMPLLLMGNDLYKVTNWDSLPPKVGKKGNFASNQRQKFRTLRKKGKINASGKEGNIKIKIAGDYRLAVQLTLKERLASNISTIGICMEKSPRNRTILLSQVPIPVGGGRVMVSINTLAYLYRESNIFVYVQFASGTRVPAIDVKLVLHKPLTMNMFEAQLVWARDDSGYQN